MKPLYWLKRNTTRTHQTEPCLTARLDRFKIKIPLDKNKNVWANGVFWPSFSLFQARWLPRWVVWSTIRPHSFGLVTKLSTESPRYTVAIGPISVPLVKRMTSLIWDVALVDCLDTSCKTHLRPDSVDQLPDQLFLRPSIWWYHPPTYNTDLEGKEEGKSFVNDDTNCVGAKTDRHRCR